MADQEGDVETQDEIPDPEFRYELHGCFDENSYDDDVERFPDFFDHNGWPLFGEYDPYMLTHPITALVWHKAPRVPRDDETEPDFNAWFELAQLYKSTLNKTIVGQRATPTNPADDPQTKNFQYSAGTKYAVAGNLAYLREHILPELEIGFKSRLISPQFALTWGDFLHLSENLQSSFPVAKRREQGRIGGRKNKMDRSPQLKWYLHWRRHQIETLGRSGNALSGLG